MVLKEELNRTKTLIRRSYPPHDSTAPILAVRNLSVNYDSGYALHEINFELPRGVRLAIVGPNGAGKSTLLKVIAGVLQPSQGEVLISGTQEPGHHICIAYVPQRSQVDWNFPISVADVVMMGRIGKLGLLRRPKKSDWEAVNQALEVVNMTGFAKRQIGELSGGQQQRMFIARALAQEAELMLMDEPLTGLDVRSQEDIYAILDALHQQGVTILVAMHDLKHAAERFDAVMLLNHRMIGIGDSNAVFSTQNLMLAYGSHRVEGKEPWLNLDDTCCSAEEEIHA